MNIQDKSIIKPLPDDSIIEEKEKKWHIKLPISYKNFLKKYNGGIPQENTFTFNKKQYFLSRFLGIIRDINISDLGWYDISVVESQIGERLTSNMDLIGMEIMPIAELMDGNYVCLDFTKSASICIWFNDKSGEFDPITETIAYNFDEFLVMLNK